MGRRIVACDCGIYAIVNKLGDHVYVGQSINMSLRKKQHFSSLEKGDHYNKRIQRCYDKYGASAIEFMILEVCDQSILTEREQFWIDQQAGKQLLNYAPVAVSPKGIKRSAETIEKRRLKMVGYKHSEQTKQKMRDAQAAISHIKSLAAIEQMKDPANRAKAGTGRKGKHLTPEHKLKVSETSKQRWADPEYKDKVSKAFSKAQKLRSANVSETMKKKWSDPEYRRHMIECRAAKRA